MSRSAGFAGRQGSSAAATRHSSISSHASQRFSSTVLSSSFYISIMPPNGTKRTQAIYFCSVLPPPLHDAAPVVVLCTLTSSPPPPPRPMCSTLRQLRGPVLRQHSRAPQHPQRVPRPHHIEAAQGAAAVVVAAATAAAQHLNRSGGTAAPRAGCLAARRLGWCAYGGGVARRCVMVGDASRVCMSNDYLLGELGLAALGALREVRGRRKEGARAPSAVFTGMMRSEASASVSWVSCCSSPQSLTTFDCQARRTLLNLKTCIRPSAHAPPGGAATRAPGLPAA